MGEKYWISGVQLSMFAYLKEKQAMDLMKAIINEQYIGNYETEKEQKEFIKKIKGLK